MYEDPIPHYLAFGNTTATAAANGYHDQHLHSSGPTSPYEQHLNADQELQRLHQHQLLIQLRLEVNSLRTQIQQLELLKQQLVQQRDLMSPGEYDQMMDQFSRTSASFSRSMRSENMTNFITNSTVNNLSNMDRVTRALNKEQEER
ncbi:hypothetical protein KI688_010557 [Linnemannia hyalina]|uniref:Uncharacterized protein n=1 Tax=Linnemannia hyalina TaxID=64524 RepID=A0A9P8BUN1_9FUNG|nr:hypothetical protein KI688_010557 [Linnemannia hyalina]